MRVPIKVVREMANTYGLTHVVIFAFDGKQQHVATYGKSIEQSGQAADFGNKLKELLDWPESLQAQPSRVRKLQARIVELTAELESLKSQI